MTGFLQLHLVLQERGSESWGCESWGWQELGAGRGEETPNRGERRERIQAMLVTELIKPEL